jgi:hypothetical protein
MALRHVVTECSPLAPWHIAGLNNKMADLASRSFKRGAAGNYDLTDSQLLAKFNSDFTLTQGASWHMHHLTHKVSSLVISELQLKRQPMGSWLRLPTQGKSFGKTGPSLSTALATQTPTSEASPLTNNLTLSAPLPRGYAMDMQEEEIKLALSVYRKRWQPLARPSNWLANPPPRTVTKAKPSTGHPSTAK